jgi:putative Tad-like protein involved in Flp pilus assembly
MNRIVSRQIRRLIKSQQGQSIVMVVISASAILTMAVSSAEVGHVYYAYRQLVTSTDEATLAGAQAMSDALLNTSSSGAYTAEVTAAVKQFSSMTGQLNASNMLSSDQIATQTLFCASTMTKAPFYVECQTPPGSSTGYNAITVTQTAKVNLWFGGLIGMPAMNLSATASAAMKGGSDIPYNLAIIMDTTASMKNTIPGDKDCTTSQIVCAVQGLEVMLQTMDPCAQNTTCTSSTPYVDDVALFVFPPVPYSSTGNYKPQYCGTGVSSVPYNFVNVTGSTNLAIETTGTDAGAYEIIPFNDVYKTNDTSSLALSSALAEAVGFSGSGCTGLSAPGGQGTYYAQVIYAAQAALKAQQGSNSASKNVMIILSDGDATACNAQTSTGNDCTSGGSNSQIVADNCPTLTTSSTTATPCPSPNSGQPLNGTSFSYTTGSGSSKKTVNVQPAGYLSPAYPSALGECGQAVQAAQLATAAGTVVYTIGFGSETTGCATDTTYTITGLSNGGQTWPGGLYPRTPCNAIAAMASNVNDFYSDNSGGCSALSPANLNFTSLAQIFEAIVDNLSTPRMIPNGTT